MRAVVQRVSKASVTVDNKTTGKIGKGLLVLLGVSRDDTEKEAVFLADKISNLRIFPDNKDLMNCSVIDAGGEVLVVSQFTLYGDCRKGRRPSYGKAAPPDKAEALYEYFINEIRKKNLPVENGIFQAMMEVHLINYGPVTILLDSEKCF